MVHLMGHQKVTPLRVQVFRVGGDEDDRAAVGLEVRTLATETTSPGGAGAHQTVVELRNLTQRDGVAGRTRRAGGGSAMRRSRCPIGFQARPDGAPRPVHRRRGCSALLCAAADSGRAAQVPVILVRAAGEELLRCCPDLH